MYIKEGRVLTLLSLAAFTSILPFELTYYFSYSFLYSNDIYSLTENAVYIFKWDYGNLVYRNNRYSLLLNLNNASLLTGEFIFLYGYGFFSGFSAYSLTLDYFTTPGIRFYFYRSPSDSYSDLIQKGLFFSYDFYLDNATKNRSFVKFALLEDYNKNCLSAFIYYYSHSFSTFFSSQYFFDPNLIKVADVSLNDPLNFFFAMDYKLFLNSKTPLLHLATETKVFYIMDNYYFLNYMIYISLNKILCLNYIHKEVYEPAEFYLKPSDNTRVLLFFKNLALSLTYRAYKYSYADDFYYFEFNIDKFKFFDKFLTLLFYLYFPFDEEGILDEQTYFSLTLNFALSKKLDLIFKFSDKAFERYLYRLQLVFKDYILPLSGKYRSEASSKGDAEAGKDKIRIKTGLEFYYNDSYTYTYFSLPQFSSYDSYDYYLYAQNFGSGFFLFFQSDYLKIGTKFYLSFTDNEIVRLYAYFGLVYIL